MQLQYYMEPSELAGSVPLEGRLASLTGLRLVQRFKGLLFACTSTHTVLLSLIDRTFTLRSSDTDASNDELGRRTISSIDISSETTIKNQDLHAKECIPIFMYYFYQGNLQIQWSYSVFSPKFMSWTPRLQGSVD